MWAVLETIMPSICGWADTEWRRRSKSKKAHNVFSEFYPPLILSLRQNTRLNIDGPEGPSKISFFFLSSHINFFPHVRGPHAITTWPCLVPLNRRSTLSEVSTYFFCFSLVRFLSATLPLLIISSDCFSSLPILDSISTEYHGSLGGSQRRCWLYSGPQRSNPKLLWVP